MIDLISVRSGTFHFRQHGREDTLAPGDCVLLDRAEPYAFEATESCALTLAMEDVWLSRWVADPATLTGRRIAADTGWGRALAAVMDELEIDRLDQLALPGGVVADQIASLLVLACGPRRLLRTPDGRLFDRLRQIVRDYAHDPEFDPAMAARQGGISLRYLHLLFARHGGTFGAALMAERLERARMLLADSHQASVSIGEIALRCGFADPGHFARRFRARFGTSPSGWRSGMHG